MWKLNALADENFQREYYVGGNPNLQISNDQRLKQLMPKEVEWAMSVTEGVAVAVKKITELFSK